MKRIVVFIVAMGVVPSAGCVFDAEPPEDAWLGDQFYVPDNPEVWHQDPIDQDALCAGVMSCAETLSMRCAGASAGQCYACCDESPWGVYLTTRCCPTDVIEVEVFDIPPDPCGVDDGCDAPDPGPDADVPFDVPPDDIGPDCGQMVCYDCQCDCGGGTWRPYGGCFDDCNPVPAVIANCSLDCTGMCDFVPGQECGQYGGWQECPEGQICVEQPCPLCGVPPQSFCVLPPCPGNGCYVDADCANGEACYLANIPGGEQGLCLPTPVEAGSCWVDRECPAQAACEGASHCDPCAECLAIQQPGRCVADAGIDEVLLWLGASMTAPGSTLVPLWFNFTDAPVFLTGCSTYSIQRMEQDGDWIDLGDPVVCIWAGVVRLDPGDARAAFPFSRTNLGGEGWTDNFRLRGEYWTGCTDDPPSSGPGCTGGPFEVLSDPVYVGAAP
jgi:hypothetical protein